MKLLLFAMSLCLTFGSTLQEQNEELRRTNKVLLKALSQLTIEQSVGDCLSEPPAPRCQGDTLVTFVDPGTADSRGCMVYGREENDCAVGHCNAAAGKCDEITANAPIPCSSMIGEDWACMGCWQNEGNACTAKKWGSPTPIEGVCNDMLGCVKAVNENSVGFGTFEFTDRMDPHSCDTCADRTCMECLYGGCFSKCTFYDGQCLSNEHVIQTGFANFNPKDFVWEFESCEEYKQIKGQEYGGRIGRL